MNLNRLMDDLEEISEGYARKFGIERTPDWYMMKLTEELGELMQSYLKCAGKARLDGESSLELRQSMEDELTDVIGMALLTARSQSVDLEKAFKRKWLKYLESPSSLD
ncbi:MazG nucleotide pyrophosphohydrolase domain-containing protein [Reinekea marinisedimentorum]|uniref:NTP pyrophosphatase (Non-canonical NTP hydrolase) n=1 Tax=Reinekea marinisedimentorum TaxID=230495 RepID=A0A4R3HZC6_9GAMM|nr:MazG nucleotide pyrophosphohydrolase domain-containing protein [Reinekea marinisedimentorum]TCS38757.1 NTP pyrophosphatase (non-canonical NTP hydrolase) [Reinekea marinisedimentorum]